MRRQKSTAQCYKTTFVPDSDCYFLQRFWPAILANLLVCKMQIDKFAQDKIVMLMVQILMWKQIEYLGILMR